MVAFLTRTWKAMPALAALALLVVLLAAAPVFAHAEEPLPADPLSSELTTAGSPTQALGAQSLVAAKAKVACPVKPGVYRIQSALEGTLELDVAGQSKKAGANVRIWTAKNRKSQQWRVIVDESGYCTVKNVRSGKVLGAAGEPAAGMNVQQQKRTGATTQLWVIKKNGNGYKLANAANTAFLLDVADASARNGANVQLCGANGNKAQRWWLIPNSPDIDAGRTVANGVYELRLASAKSYSLDVANGSRSNGANVQLYSRNKSMAQRWVLKLGSDGYYSVRSVVSGKALEVAGAAAAVRANVRQRSYSGSDTQRWAVQKNGDGTYTLLNKASGLALDITNGKAANGTNARVSVAQNGKSQRFSLKKVDMLPAGAYVIRSLAASSLAVDVPDFSTKAGVRLQVWKANDAIAQRFYLRRIARSTYTVQSVCSGMYVTDQGGKVTQRPASGLAAQQWKAMLSGEGIALVNKATGKRLALAGGNTGASTKLSTYKAASETARFIMEATDLVPDGCYVVENAASGNVLDIAGVSTANGANVQVYKATNGGNQAFAFEGKGNNVYTITSALSGLAVEVADGSKANNANVQQWSKTGAKAQRWKLSLDAKGNLKLKNVASGKVLTAAGKGASGANVKSKTDAGVLVQRWSLVPSSYEPDATLNRAISIANGLSSSTGYLILVDVTNNRTVVFQGSKGSWSVLKNWVVSTGAPESPTVLGDYTVTGKGYSFGAGSGHTCYYYTQFYGDYLFHSVLYNEGTFDIQDGRLGYNVSQGCVRMDINDAKWIYDNIPYSTHVRIYQ